MIRTWMTAVALSLAAMGSAQIDPNKVIASVNGEQITANEYYHRMEFLQGVSMDFGGQQVRSTPGFFTITKLIGEKLIFQLAKNKGISPSPQEIQDELSARMTGNPNYLKDRADEGLTEADVRTLIKYDLAKFKLQTEGVTVTDQEVQQQYKANPKSYTTPKQVHVRTIAVRNQSDEKAVDADLAAGKSFADVAKARSADVTQPLGGDMGTVLITYFSKDAGSAINSTKIGSTTSWITVNDTDPVTGKELPNVIAYAKYQLVGVVPEHLVPLDKMLTLSIRRTLMLNKSQNKTDLAKEIDDMRTSSKVTITDPTFQALWNQMQKGS